jgi:ubiquitin-conjugating enzyme E2 variant
MEVVLEWVSSVLNFGLSIIIGSLTADFATGLFHWFEDQYLHHESWICQRVWFLRLISEQNVKHHIDPLFMVQFGTIQTIMMSIPFVTVAAIFLGFCGFLLHPFSLTLLILSLFTNEFHKLSHQIGHKSKWIRKLQDAGIILSAKRHRLHHIYFDRAYCVTSGLMNFPLDAIRFWDKLELLIFVSTGIEIAHLLFKQS